MRLHGWLFVLPALDRLRRVRALAARPDVQVLALPLGRRRPGAVGRARQLQDRLQRPRPPQRPGARVRADHLLQRHPGRARPGGRDRDAATGVRAGSARSARTVLFLPQVVPLVAAGIAWSWVLSSDGRRQPGLCRRSASAASRGRGSATSARRCRRSASSAPGCCSASAPSCCSPA